MDSDSEIRGCSIAGAVEIFGDRWSLLILRDLAVGITRFDELARNTGAPRDILTTRLRRLEDAGILKREPYQERPLRHDYVPTDRGRDLMPVLLALRSWGDKHITGLPPTAVVHNCGHHLETVISCAACGQPVRPDELTLVPTNPGVVTRPV